MASKSKPGPKIRGKRGMNSPPGIPKMPPTAKLNATGKKAWKRLSENLKKASVDSPIYVDAMVLYCQAWERYDEARIKLKEVESPVLVGEKGGMYLNPWVGILNLAKKDIIDIGKLFGLTPRSAMNIDSREGAAEEGDEFDELLRVVG